MIVEKVAKYQFLHCLELFKVAKGSQQESRKPVCRFNSVSFLCGLQSKSLQLASR